MDTIKQYDYTTDEYAKLTIAANEMTRNSMKGTQFKVEDTYFDLGQGWMWTTIVAHRPDGERWQVLYPKQHEDIILSKDIPATIHDIMTDKFWYE